MKSIKGKTLGICIATFVFLMMAVGSGSSKDNDTPTKVGEVTTQNTTTTNSTNANTEDSSEGASQETKDESEGSDPVPEQKSEYHVGDIIQTKDLKIVYKASGDYTSDNQFMQPDEVTKYIFIELYCENISQSDTTITSFSFDCYADGYACDQSYINDNGLSATLSSGRSTTGKVYFTVPTDAAEIQIEYEVNAFTEEKVIFAFDGDADSGFVADNTVSASEDAFKVGDIITTKDLVITYLSSGEYVSDNMFMQPNDGYQYIYCEFEFENISDSDKSVSYFNFDCFADGVSCDGFYGIDNSLSASISPKRKAKGKVAFEVPIGAEVVEVEYLTNAWTSNRIVFTYK